MPLRRVSVGELARRAHVSRGYLNRLSRAAFGLSAAAALERARCARAESLLLRTDLTVESIAYQCGFADSSHFSHRFTAIHGVSPRAYRVAGTLSPSVLDDPGVRRLSHLLWGWTAPVPGGARTGGRRRRWR
jgi:AraC-like DNA-binding protein